MCLLEKIFFYPFSEIYSGKEVRLEERGCVMQTVIWENYKFLRRDLTVTG